VPVKGLEAALSKIGCGVDHGEMLGAKTALRMTDFSSGKVIEEEL
jgi:hypothetical protein